jgi:group I intron endonuclease
MKICGIYCIHNVVNGKRYVGQSVDIVKRKRHHLWALKNGSHDSQYLQRSFSKHGESNFEFVILEETSEDMLDIREKAWITYYRSSEQEFGYNVEPGGCGGYHHASPETCENLKRTNAGRKFSDETRKKMSEARIRSGTTPARLEVLNKMSEGNIGRKKSQEEIEKLRLVHIGSKRSVETRQRMSESAKHKPPVSEETRRRMSEATKGRPRTWFPSPETLVRMSEAHKNPSIETRRKMSGARIGKKLSAETCRRMGESKIGKKIHSEEFKQRLIEYNRNRIITPEMRANMSRAQKLRFPKIDVVEKSIWD